MSNIINFKKEPETIKTFFVITPEGLMGYRTTNDVVLEELANSSTIIFKRDGKTVMHALRDVMRIEEEPVNSTLKQYMPWWTFELSHHGWRLFSETK